MSDCCVQKLLNWQEGLRPRELQRHCNWRAPAGGDLWPAAGCNLKVNSIGIPGGEMQKKEKIQ